MRQSFQSGKERAIRFKQALLVEHRMYDDVAALEFGAIRVRLCHVTLQKRNFMRAQDIQPRLLWMSDQARYHMTGARQANGRVIPRISRDACHKNSHSAFPPTVGCRSTKSAALFLRLRRGGGFTQATRS